MITPVTWPLIEHSAFMPTHHLGYETNCKFCTRFKFTTTPEFPFSLMPPDGFMEQLNNNSLRYHRYVQKLAKSVPETGHLRDTNSFLFL